MTDTGFRPASYPDVVRDLLTWLTQGVAGEAHPVPITGLTELRFEAGPARRVSHVVGEIELDPTAGTTTPYRFTERDFDPIHAEGASDALAGVRFGKGQVPAPGTTLVVNYYPVRLAPAPVNDVAAGSVVRTLLETFAREVAAQQEQLRLVYESAFVETATGTSLDNVVALLDVQRLSRRHPIGKVRMSRRAGAAGAVTIPVETAVTDGSGNRYLTTDPVTMLPAQSAVEVWVHGESPATEPVDAGALVVLERAIAGVDRVTNPEPTFRAAEEETDEQLRTRARAAAHRAGRGTLDAIRSAVEALPFVSAVALTELPEGIPGTLRVDVSLAEDTPANRHLVEARVEEFRPAGIAVTIAYAGRLPLAVEVGLTLAGSFAPASVVDEITAGARDRIQRVAGSLAPGATLRRARLVAAVLEDPRIVDTTVGVTASGSLVAEDAYTVPAGVAVQLDPARDVTFRPVAYEGGATGGPSVVPVDVRLRVTPFGSATVPAVQARARDLLAPVVGGAAALSTDTVQAALAGETAFVALAAHTVIAVEIAPGQFVDVRPGDPAYAPAAGATFELRDVLATQDGAS